MGIINKVSKMGLIMTLLSVIVMITVVSLGFTANLSMNHQNIVILYVFIGWLVPASLFYIISDLTEE